MLRVLSIYEGTHKCLRHNDVDTSGPQFLDLEERQGGTEGGLTLLCSHQCPSAVPETTSQCPKFVVHLTNLRLRESTMSQEPTPGLSIAGRY